MKYFTNYLQSQISELFMNLIRKNNQKLNNTTRQVAKCQLTTTPFRYYTI